MLCLISFIFILWTVSALESDVITCGQAILFSAYALIVFYHTSKPYWTKE